MLLLALAASAWATDSSRQSSSLPELPEVNPDGFPPAVRDKVREAYAAVRANPEAPAVNGKLGMLLHAYQPADERAEICYRRARRFDPKSFRWAYYLGLVQAARGNTGEAISTLREALRLDPDYLPAQIKLSEWLLASDSAQEAQALLEGIVRRYPDSAQAHYVLGRARKANEDLTGAVEAFRRACELFPYFGVAHYALGLAYKLLGEDERAGEEFALFKAHKYDIPGTGDRLQAELNALYINPTEQMDLGVELARQGKLEQAAAAHEKALETDPQMTRAHINLISLYGRLKQYEKAEQHYQEAVRQDPDSEESHYNYGVLLTRWGKHQEAEKAFRKAVAADPGHAEARNNLGDLLQRQSRLAEAEAEFRKAIESRPGFPQAHFNLGRILVNRGNHREGIQELLKALNTEDPDSRPSYLYAVGAAYVRAGEKETGVNYMRLAREKAAAQRQEKLLESIDRDLETLKARDGR
jgi:tetratricopeptide (TPR) repeat protein